MKLFKSIKAYIELLETSTISEERKAILQPLIDYLSNKAQAGETTQLNFICTHNSRRSQLAQVWARTMADYFNTPNIECYSGGTEATSVYPMVVTTLENAGFKISREDNGNNPIYRIQYSLEKNAIGAFSKKYEDEVNPKKGFAAIMTCSQADEGCPFVAGSEKRIPIMYEDPKSADDTPHQTQIYTERSQQITTEMKYIFSQIKY
ncbi:protein-tyrosine-phosphatase [Aequorivita sp. SDUM287046]|uniref:Protein-tyrosine-phosphatase n=1 Tax=Aequorivita aurantiaca TaxID=3053356 RepID=A0ABT8DN95_9FLAO|nr:protein-tyrosine-phosphatase [Aequorivita aurantiaca]MDN3725451.1 protein-tyrosine-phosphatase [Aequorivita aurantiaca]